MEITKDEALALAKILHPHDSQAYQVAMKPDGRSTFQRTLDGICERIETFLVGDAGTCEEGCEHAEEEEGEEEGEEEEEEEEEEDKKNDADGCDLTTDYVADGEVLHRLVPAKSSKGMLEFECIVQPTLVRVDLLLDGTLAITEVTHLRRFAKELHVRDVDNEWRVFRVSKFPKGWSDVLPINELVEVSA